MPQLQAGKAFPHAVPALPSCALLPSRCAGSPQVLIASLKAGGVGLNLTSASHIHLLDPWW